MRSHYALIEGSMNNDQVIQILSVITGENRWMIILPLDELD
jgi:hypothetical protein